MPHPIQVLTVDAAGTLVQPWPSIGAVYGKTARDHGISVKDEEVNEQFLAVFAKIQKNIKITQGEEKDFWREVVSKVLEPFADGQNIDPIFEILWNLFAEGKHWRVAQNAESTLLTLKQRGYKLAVLSNNDSRLRSVLEDHKIDSLFDHLFISSELGAEKPDQAIFQAVEKKFNLPPSSFMHLGDSHSRDFEGAKSAGWSALLYGNPVIEKEQITSFPELLKYLP